MSYRLTFETDNAAFAENPRQEIEQILQFIAESIFHGDGGKIRDSNGNTIGSWSYEPADEDD